MKISLTHEGRLEAARIEVLDAARRWTRGEERGPLYVATYEDALRKAVKAYVVLLSQKEPEPEPRHSDEGHDGYTG